MDAEDWARLGILGDQIALQWYTVTHPQAQMPGQNQVTIPLPGPGGQANFNSNLLIIGVIVIAAIVLMK